MLGIVADFIQRPLFDLVSRIHAGVRLCLGGEPADRLELGLQIVARLIRSRPEPALLAI